MMDLIRTSDVPKNWSITNMGEVTELLRGVTYQKQEASKEPMDGLVPILRANNIEGELIIDDLVYVPSNRITDEQLIKKHDIIIAMSSGSRNLVGKAAQATADFNGAFGAFCGLVRVSQQLNKKYVGFFFKSHDYRRRIAELSSGVNINNLRRDHIESLSIPIPPFPEQHRIVAKIEELFSDLDAGVEALKKAKAQLKRYRQAVLKAAFEGRPTAAWRDKNKDEPEPGAALLERVKGERKKDAPSRYKDHPPLDASHLPKIPDSWIWTRFGEIGVIASGQTPKELNTLINVTGDIPFFKVGDMNRPGNEKFMVNSETYISKDDCNKYGIHIQREGTVIFPKRGGAIATNKKRILAKPSCYDLNTMGVYPLAGLSMLFYYWIFGINLATLSDGSNVPQINHKDIEPLPFPLPPISEQHKILEEIELKFSLADEVEKTVDKGLKQSERLRQSILKKAFQGKLVPQDPVDEPAAVLLERIKKERATQVAGKKPGRRAAQRKLNYGQ